MSTGDQIMLKNKLTFVVLTIIGFILPIAGLAQVEENGQEIFFLGHNTGVGARAMGMGGAYVGVADDYSAIFWNPAGLAQIRRMEMNIGFSHNSTANDATFLGNKTNSTLSATRLNSLGFVFPVPTYQGSMVLAVGYNKVRDFDNTMEAKGFNKNYAAFPNFVIPSYEDPSLRTDINDSLEQSQSLLEEGSLNNFTISGALEVQQDFFLGASLNFVTGKDDYNFDFTESDIYNIYHEYLQGSDEYGDFVIANDLDTWTLRNSIVSDFSAANFKIGALYRFNRMLKLGGTIVFPTTQTITETWSQTIEETYDGNNVMDPYTVGDKNEYKIQEPYMLSAGASLQLVNLLLSGAVEYKDWSQAKFKTDPPIDKITKGEVNSYIKHYLKGTTTLRLGAEFFVPVINARLRAGYTHVPTAYKQTPLDLDKDYISLGASLMLDKQVMLNLAMVRGSWKKVVDETGSDWENNLTNTVTSQDLTFNKMVGTLSIRF